MSQPSPTAQPAKLINTYFIGGVAALSGILFGFDASIAAAVGGSVNSHFLLQDKPFLQGLWVAAVPLGALVGALAGGVVSGRLGRRGGLLLNAVLFILGILVSATSPTFGVYVFSRLLMGLAIGNSAVLTPMYMAEVAPPDSRGKVLFLYQLSIVIGILVSFLVGVVVDLLITDTNLNWRVMIGIGLVPATLFLLGMLQLPRSPRWLVEVGRHDEARGVLEGMVGPEQAHETLAEIRAAAARETRVDIRACLSRLILPVILLGFFLQFFQQSTGINADMYFGPEIFREGGFSHTASMWAQVAMGLVNLVATVVAIFLVDRIGRRRLMFIGVSGIIVMLVVQAVLFHRFETSAAQQQAPTSVVVAPAAAAAAGDGHAVSTASRPGQRPALPNAAVPNPRVASEKTASLSGGAGLLTYLIFGSILLYIVFFAISAGPLCWLIISEIFPIKFRGIGMSIAVAGNWLVDYFVSQLFPVMKTGLGMPTTCLIYGAFTFVGLLLAHRFLPETQGVPLETIEANIYAGKPLRMIGR